MLPIDDKGRGASGIPRSTLRQAVVRIRSVQSFVPATEEVRNGERGQEGGREKDVTELVVIQKRVLRGKEEPWKVWGTTTETSRKDLEVMVNRPQQKMKRLSSDEK